MDLDTGAIVSVTVQDASDGDTATLPETLIMAAEQVESVQPDGAGVEEVVADKGYHSDETLVALDEIGVRSHVSEPERGRRCWQDKKTGETPPEKGAAQKDSGATRQRLPRSPRLAAVSLDWRSRPSSGPRIVSIQVDCRLRDELPVRAYAPRA